MNDGLSPEDSFRLQVLLAQELKAVRLDESEAGPVLHALTDRGEAHIPLNPNCRLDKYLRLIRELLSGHALIRSRAVRIFFPEEASRGKTELQFSKASEGTREAKKERGKKTAQT